MRHDKCGHEYFVKPKNFNYGDRCPECGKKKPKGNNAKLSKTTKKFKEEVFNLVGYEYSVLGEYVNWNTKISIRHNVCNRVYSVEPNSFLCGKRCYECRLKEQSERQSKSNEDFVKELRNKYGNEFIPLKKYTRNNVKIPFKHSKCGHIWESEPANVLWGYGCPRCNSSKGERITLKVLGDLGIKFTHQKSFLDLKGYSKNLYYDFYLPNLNTVVEYQGIQHYEPVEIFGGEGTYIKQVEYDDRKREYSKNNNLNQIDIPYYVNTYEEIYNMLTSLLNL